VDEGRKRVIAIMASILAARKLANYDGGKRVPATMSAISDAIQWAEEIMKDGENCKSVRYRTHRKRIKRQVLTVLCLSRWNDPVQLTRVENLSRHQSPFVFRVWSPYQRGALDWRRFARSVCRTKSETRVRVRLRRLDGRVVDC
jgi:hypothetical protein